MIIMRVITIIVVNYTEDMTVFFIQIHVNGFKQKERM